MSGVVLILGYDSLGAVERAVRYVKGRGLCPFVVLNTGGADYGHILLDGLILRSEHVNCNHVLLATEIVKRLDEFFGPRKWKIEGVVNFQDRMWLCYIDLMRRFNCHSELSPAVLERTVIKANLRNLLKGSPLGVTYEVVDCTASKDALSTSKLLAMSDVIVKPLVGMAGEGVHRVHRRDVAGFYNAVQSIRALQNSLYADAITCRMRDLGDQPVQLNRYALLEEYVEGTEFSVEGTAGDPDSQIVQMKTRQKQVPVFADLEYAASKSLSTVEFSACIGELLSVTGFPALPYHIELKARASDGVLLPVEFNPRMGGGSIVELVKAVEGFDPLDVALKVLVRNSRPDRWFVTTVVQPERTGTLRQYSGLTEVESQPDCVFVKKMVQEGTSIDSIDREVYLVEFCMVGETMQAATRRASEMNHHIRAVIE